MGWLSDALDEFSKLPPVGKGAVLLAVGGVAVLGIVAARNSAGSAGGNVASGAVTGAFPGLTGGTTTYDSAGGSWNISTPTSPANAAPFNGLFNGTGLAPRRTLTTRPAPTPQQPAALPLRSFSVIQGSYSPN